jgi:hypothetical protein
VADLKARVAPGLIGVAVGLVIWAFGPTGPAQACLACIAMPAESLADKAAAADAVALLRPDPDDPFRFAVVGWVKGGPVTDPVLFLVSRARAAEMAAAPDSVIVATWSHSAGWAMHDLGPPALPAVLADVLSRDLASPEARSAVFAPLVAHHDPAVARMALVELATLPYAVLRNTGARMDRAFVARAEADPLWSEWAPVAILLLGLSDDPADRAFVQRAATLAVQGGRTVNLGAWLTALIETDTALAMDLIRQSYLHDPARTEAELQQVGLALASHAGRKDATGDTILALAGELAARHPAVAAAIVQTMTDRGDWSLAAAAGQWLDSGVVTSPGDAFVLTSYVLAASQAELAQ